MRFRNRKCHEFKMIKAGSMVAIVTKLRKALRCCFKLPKTIENKLPKAIKNK